MNDVLTAPQAAASTTSIRWFADLGLADLEQVGGENASLGEMISQLASAGVRVPDGFDTTADAYRRFLGTSGLVERINELLEALDPVRAA